MKPVIFEMEENDKKKYPQIKDGEFVQKELNKFYKRYNKEGLIIDTVGLELESIGLTEGDVKGILNIMDARNSCNFKFHADASAQMQAYYINVQTSGRRLLGNRNILISAHTETSQNIFSNSNKPLVSGYELVSTPMDIAVAEVSVMDLIPRLVERGDFLSERCATHIHVGMGKNVSFLKNLLTLGLWADELFYSISGMEGGRPFRGYSNNAIYSRPLISGPYAKGGNGNYYQILNWKKALDAESLAEFFACYGFNYGEAEAIKYIPARYFSVNLFSILLHKTIEFRHFNQSFDAPLIIAVAKLCQLFAEIGVKANQNILRNFEPGDVFTFQSPSYYIRKLEKIIELGRTANCDYTLRQKDISSLCKVIETYQGIGIKDNSVLSHIKDASVSQEMVREGGLKICNTRPIPDGHIDIHNIKYVTIMPSK